MKSEREIRAVWEDLGKLTAYISDVGGSVREGDKKAMWEELREVSDFLPHVDMEKACEEFVTRANDAWDALSWVLGEPGSDYVFLEEIVGLKYLRQVAAAIEKRVGKSFEEYE